MRYILNQNNETYYFHTENLSVGYQGKAIVKDISFSLKKGEILTLIGPNGGGKTTILKSLIQQLPQITGHVYLESRDLQNFSAKELSQKLSIVLTQRISPELMTCYDVVSTGRFPYTGHFGILSEQDKQIVLENMDMVGVSDLKDQDFMCISDGQKQRVLLARALCQKPEILILDEPTSFLDIRYKLEFLAVLLNMAKEHGLTVIMSLHELDLASRVSDQLLCIKGDYVDRHGTPQEIFSGDYIRQLYEIPEDTLPEKLQGLIPKTTE